MPMLPAATRRATLGSISAKPSLPDLIQQQLAKSRWSESERMKMNFFPYLSRATRKNVIKQMRSCSVYAFRVLNHSGPVMKISLTKQVVHRSV
jgi:hypothetical protein